MTLVAPPSFRSPEALSARFRYSPRGVQNHTQIFGTTGHSFVRRAWDVLHRIDFSSLKPGPTSGPTAYSLSPLTEKPFSTEWQGGVAGVTRGSRWDNDFNRALWAWVYLQWQGAERRNVVSPETRDAWVRQLSIIEACEKAQRVSLEAQHSAARLVADSFGLIDNVTTPRVSFDNGTVTLPYGVDPPNPGPIATSRGYEFKTWAAGSEPETGRWLSDSPRPSETPPIPPGTTPVPPGGTPPTETPPGTQGTPPSTPKASKLVLGLAVTGASLLVVGILVVTLAPPAPPEAQGPSW